MSSLRPAPHRLAVTRPRTRSLTCGGRARRRAFRLGGFARRGRARRGTPARGRALCLPRQRAMRGRAARFVLEHILHRTRDTRSLLRLAFALPDLIGIFGAAPRAALDPAALRRRQIDAARRASDRPMAIACLVERAPCSPRRILSISPCTNSPAWVEGDLPAPLSSRAFSMMRLSGMLELRCVAVAVPLSTASRAASPALSVRFLAQRIRWRN